MTPEYARVVREGILFRHQQKFSPEDAFVWYKSQVTTGFDLHAYAERHNEPDEGLTKAEVTQLNGVFDEFNPGYRQNLRELLGVRPPGTKSGPALKGQG